METIFLGACIYEEGQFIGSGMLKTLFEAAKERRISILLPEVTEHEVLAHILSIIRECVCMMPAGIRRKYYRGAGGGLTR